MPDFRQAMLPYGMARNPDGSWTFFNRKYKPVGIITDEWSEWDVPQHRMKLKGLGPATLRKLDIHAKGTGDRVYFYDDGSVPTRSAHDMERYLAKLKILMGLNVGYD
jgi:hypothetical protein